MTPKTFWTIFLKIFGLYLIWQTLILLPSLFSTLIYMGTLPDRWSAFTTLSSIVLICSTFALVFRCCIFKTDWIIEKLKLESGFEEERIEINIHRSSLLSIAIIVLGGLMLADGLPLLIFNVLQYIQHSEAYSKILDNRATPYLASNFLKVIIGYFMVADSRLVVNFIERKRKKAN